MRIVELLIAGVLALGGVRSMVMWFGTQFEAQAIGEQVLYSIHAASRVALWLAFAGFFAGYALLDEPQDFKWYFLVPIALAGVQLLTGLVLARPPSTPRPNRDSGSPHGGS